MLELIVRNRFSACGGSFGVQAERPPPFDPLLLDTSNDIIADPLRKRWVDSVIAVVFFDPLPRSNVCRIPEDLRASCLISLQDWLGTSLATQYSGSVSHRLLSVITSALTSTTGDRIRD